MEKETSRHKTVRLVSGDGQFWAQVPLEAAVQSNTLAVMLTGEGGSQFKEARQGKVNFPTLSADVLRIVVAFLKHLHLQDSSADFVVPQNIAAQVVGAAAYLDLPGLEFCCIDIISQHFAQLKELGDLPSYLIDKIVSKVSAASLCRAERMIQREHRLDVDIAPLWLQLWHRSHKKSDISWEEARRKCMEKALEELAPRPAQFRAQWKHMGHAAQTLTLHHWHASPKEIQGFLQCVPSLTYLDVSGNRWTRECIQALTLALKTRSVELIRLELCNNGLREDAARCLSSALQGLSVKQRVSKKPLIKPSVKMFQEARSPGQRHAPKPFQYRGVRKKSSSHPRPPQSTTPMSLILNNMNLDIGGMLSLVEVIQRKQALNVLALSGNPLGSIGATWLGQALRSSTKRLKELRVARCAFGQEGLITVLRAVSGSSLLNVLDVRGNASVCGRDGGIQLGKTVERCLKETALHILLMGSNTLSPATCDGLARGIQGCSTLKELDVCNAELTKEASRALAPSVGLLDKLNMSKNRCGDGDALGGVGCIAQSLMHVSQLTVLNMSLCQVSAKDAGILAAFLAKDTVLQVLILEETEDGPMMGNEGMCLLARGLWCNTSLRQLTVARHGIGNLGCSMLGKALVQCRVDMLNIGHNAIGERGIRDMVDALRMIQRKLCIELGGNAVLAEQGAARELLEQVVKEKHRLRIVW